MSADGWPHSPDEGTDRPDAGLPWSKRTSQITTVRKSAPRADAPVRLRLLHSSGGLIEPPVIPEHRVFLHVGTPVPTTCGAYGAPRRRLAERGDIDVIPGGGGGGGFWIDEAPGLSLQIAIAPAVLDRIGRETGRRLPGLEPKGPVRDTTLEPIGWALKAELDAGEPTGSLYLDSLALALGARLLAVFGEEARRPEGPAPLSPRRMQRVVDYIEAHLDQDLSLDRIAGLAGLSPSHFKTAFRQAAGLPLHQYVIRRRVERARLLLAAGGRSISEVALEVGFAHQSHLNRWTRRLLNASPKELMKQS
jgi:AraC family transcriptional regulator